MNKRQRRKNRRKEKTRSKIPVARYL